MEISPEACFKFIQTEAPRHAEAKGEVIRLESKLKAVKGALMDSSEASSIAMKEADAYRHTAYMETVQELKEATVLETKLNTLIKAAFAKLEIFKVMEYTKRQEVKQLG
jgi:hypothetical protein